MVTSLHTPFTKTANVINSSFPMSLFSFTTTALSSFSALFRLTGCVIAGKTSIEVYCLILSKIA